MKSLYYGLAIVLTAFGLLIFATPWAFAYTINHYDSCTGWSDNSTYGSCTEAGGTAVFGIGENWENYVASSNTETTPFLTAGTWYVSITMDGDSGNLRFCDNDTGCIEYFTATTLAQEYTSTGSAYLQFASPDGSGFTGEFSFFCITDVSGYCETPPEEEVATTTPTETTTNDDLVFGLGLIIFILATIFGTYMVSIFKKNAYAK